MNNYHLLLVLIIVYLAECVIFHDQEAVIISKFFNKWKCKFPELNYSSLKTPFIIKNIFFPFFPIFVINPFPILFSFEGILVLFKNKTKSYLFSEIKSISCSTNKILINNKEIIKLFSHKQALIHYHHITDLINTKIHLRQPKIIKIIEKTFNLKSIKSQLNLFNNNIFFLKIIPTIVFLLLFFILPVYYYFYAFNFTFIKILFAILFFHFLIVVFFYLTHKKIYPLLKEERFFLFLALMFSPPASVRAIQYIAKNLILEYDPIAITTNFGNNKIQFKLIELILRKVNYKKFNTANPLNKNIYESFNKNYLKVLQKFIKNRKINIEQFKKIPAPETEEMHKYCPLCLTQFKQEIINCSECKIKLLNL